MTATPPPEAPAAPGRFTYKHLNLAWDPAVGAWTCPLRELGVTASLRLFSALPEQPPTVLACEVVLATLVLLDRIDLDARRHLESEAGFYISEHYRCRVSVNDFVPESLELSADPGTDRFALTYRARFDPQTIWKVRFRGLMPLQWRVERLSPDGRRGGSAGGIDATLLDFAARPAHLLRRWLGGLLPYTSGLRLH
ncbi:hypothetical protein OOT46_20760 [Aquabacterium sp. A7-Y]|uniref:hypothetical protein n=1 Tax=Aquabacterium sp. A7-Y TaxID=1349605 RepID=UPI00223E8BEB|nr:hypothetical protein [Aquabacterium sp. A7-Y]MCW7540269.1 hypothetical protein [Aquabacterium sp. A7-Y]